MTDVNLDGRPNSLLRGTGQCVPIQAAMDLAGHLKAGTGITLTVAPQSITIAAPGAAGGTVTSITAGTGLSGGTITSTGTIALLTPVSIANGGTGRTAPNAKNAKPGNPTGTSASGGVMAGLAISFTPNSSGAVLVVVSAQMTSSVTNGGPGIEIRYGSGAAPANGAALTGTSASAVLAAQVATANWDNTLTVQAIISGLTVGTAYWFDLGQYSVFGGTINLANITYSIVEL